MAKAEGFTPTITAPSSVSRTISLASGTADNSFDDRWKAEGNQRQSDDEEDDADGSRSKDAGSTPTR